MKRREFFGLGLTALMASLPLSAVDFRKEKAGAWTEKNVFDDKKPTMAGIDSAIKDLYGDVKVEESGIKLKLPKVANNGGQVPVAFKSSIDAKSVAVFQNVNPESLVAVFDINENMVVDNFLKIKMKQSGDVAVVVEGRDGKYYMAKQSIEVALGGCEG